MEKILNRRNVRGKLKYLVRQKGYTAKEDTWEGPEILRNIMGLVEKFEKETRKKEIRRVQQRKQKSLNTEVEVFKRSKLSEKYTTKILFKWDNNKI